MKTAKLGNVLASAASFEPDINRWNVSEIKKAAALWVGRGYGTMCRAEVESALKTALKSGGAQVVDRLKSDEEKILSIVARYGGGVCGEVLSAELHARGLASKERDSWRSRSVTTSLCARLALFHERSYWGSSGEPSVILPPALRAHIEAAKPLTLPAKKVEQPAKVRSGGFRSSAEVQLDLLGVHEFLNSIDGWNPLRGGSLPKGVRNRLAKRHGKSAPTAAAEAMPLPDADSFCYEILRGLGLVEGDEYGMRAVDDISMLAAMTGEEFLWRCVRAWLSIRHWQDGIGVVKPNINEWDPQRIEFDKIDAARALLGWGLARLAHSGLGWVDLQSFLAELDHATINQSPTIYFSGYVWKPKFDRAGLKAEAWDDSGGMSRGGMFWMANALMVTLHALGLVERGEV